MLKKFFILALSIGLLSARVVVDSYGKEVQIPDEITRASPLHHTGLQISLMLGNEDKLVFNQPRVPPTPLLDKVFPQIHLSPNKSGSSASSIETIIASKPQVAFGPTGLLFDENAKKQLEAAGIAVVTIHKFLRSIDEVKENVSIIAQIYGGKSIKKAKEFIAFTDENIKFVSQKTKNITSKKRVLSLSSRSGNLTAMGDKFVGAEYIKIAGGINVSKENIMLSKVWNTINEEQVIIFNPDIIITYSQKDLDEILKIKSLKEVKAVKSKQIFIIPSGVFSWVPPNAEGTLQILWLAKMFYPNEFKDLNLESKVREFYERFYNYKLSNSELKEILNPVR